MAAASARQRHCQAAERDDGAYPEQEHPADHICAGVGQRLVVLCEPAFQLGIELRKALLQLGVELRQTLLQLGVEAREVEIVQFLEV